MRSWHQCHLLGHSAFLHDGKHHGVDARHGGELKRMADVSLHVPVMNMQLSEDVHMIFDHLMMTVFMSAGLE